MTGSLRLILEMIANPGSTPELQVDSNELDPAAYEIEGLQTVIRQIAPADTLAVALPACCLLVIVASEPVLLRLASGETQMRTRQFVTGAEDSSGTAFPAGSILLSGNTSTTATVRIYALPVVT